MNGTKIIGAKGYTMGSIAMSYRCLSHVDSATLDTPVYEGESLVCDYCDTLWTDGLTPEQRYERDNNVKFCGRCLSYSAPFTGKHCDQCMTNPLCMFGGCGKPVAFTGEWEGVTLEICAGCTGATTNVKPITPVSVVVEMDHDDTMDMTHNDVSWSVKIGNNGHGAFMAFASEPFENIRVEITYFGRTDWTLNVKVDGTSVYRLNAGEWGDTDLDIILNQGVSVASEEYDSAESDDYYDAWEGDYDYDGYDCGGYEFDSDLMNEW